MFEVATVVCSRCNGSGQIWVDEDEEYRQDSARGRTIPAHSERCPACEGAGIITAKEQKEKVERWKEILLCTLEELKKKAVRFEASWPVLVAMDRLDSVIREEYQVTGGDAILSLVKKDGK